MTKAMTKAEFDDSIISSVVHRQFSARIALALEQREALLAVLKKSLPSERKGAPINAVEIVELIARCES